MSDEMLVLFLMLRGVARNLLMGDKTSGGRKPPSGVQGQSPGGGLGRSPQKLDIYTECITVF